MSDQPLVEIPANDLLAVMPYRAAPGEVRFYLEGILIDPVESGGCMLVATDGHMMGVIHSKAARCDKTRILRVSRELHKALREAAFSYESKTVSVQNEESRLTLSAVAGGQLIKELFVLPGDPFIGGKIVEWRKVVPPLEALKPGNPAHLPAKYLARLNRSLAALSDRHTGLTFWYDERAPKDKAVVARFDHIKELVVLIMPIREQEEVKWPEWYPKGEKPAEEPKPAEAAA